MSPPFLFEKKQDINKKTIACSAEANRDPISVVLLFKANREWSLVNTPKPGTQKKSVNNSVSSLGQINSERIASPLFVHTSYAKYKVLGETQNQTLNKKKLNPFKSESDFK